MSASLSRPFPALLRSSISRQPHAAPHSPFVLCTPILVRLGPIWVLRTNVRRTSATGAQTGGWDGTVAGTFGRRYVHLIQRGCLNALQWRHPDFVPHSALLQLPVPRHPRLRLAAVRLPMSRRAGRQMSHPGRPGSRGVDSRLRARTGRVRGRGAPVEQDLSVRAVGGCHCRCQVNWTPLPHLLVLVCPL